MRAVRTIERVTRVCAASLVLFFAMPAAAQSLTLREAGAPSDRPADEYAGVEPGEAEPPPAAARAERQRQRRPRPASILTWPGFTPRPGGGSRFFVQTTDPVVPEVRVERDRVVLRFPNTRIHVRNSARWLETRFFDTPVLRARLVRDGRDMTFVLHLRSPATPRVSSAPSSDGRFHYVYIDFPAGVGAVEPATGSGPPPAPARAIDSALTGDEPAG